MPKDPPKSNGSEPLEDDEPEFDRFKDLTRRLLTVPKRELDALRKGEPNGH